MLSWPYLILNGYLPYKDIAIAHTPGLLATVVIFFKILGIGVWQLKFFTWLLILSTDLILFFVTLKLGNKKTAISALGVFIVLQTLFEGNGLWFDLAVVPLVLIVYYLVKTQKYFAAGVLWVIMFFTKQTAVWFLAPILIEILFNAKEFKLNLSRFIYGSVFAVLVYVVGLFYFGILTDFINWAIGFGVIQLPRSGGQIQVPGIKQLAAVVFPFILFVPLMYSRKFNNKSLISWALAGAMFSYPRFEFFHLQPALPFIAIASGWVLGLKSAKSKNQKMLKIFWVVFIVGLTYLYSGFFLRNYHEGIRFYEVAVFKTSSYIEDHTYPGEKIFVLNYWDNLYALSQTMPATKPLVPQLQWYQDLPGVKEDELNDLMEAKPNIVVLKPYEKTGLASYVPKQIYEYILENYDLVENIEGIEVYNRK